MSADHTFYGIVKIGEDPEKSSRISYEGLSNKKAITLDGPYGSVGLIDHHGNREMLLSPDAGDGRYSALFLGLKKAGIMLMRNKAGEDSIFMDGVRGSIGLYDLAGDRNMLLDPNAGDRGEYSALFLGLKKAGIMVIRNKAGWDSIVMDGNNSIMVARNKAGEDSIVMDGNNSILHLNGQVMMRDKAGKNSIVMDGPSGDIVLNNADCAEDFDISHSTETEPGTVMVIEQEGKLKECDLPYDKRVAGVISGAGNYKPGLVLDKRKSIESRKSISLMGKVHCKVDAQSASIDVGDLLTTSSTKGHAMKAADPAKAFGSVIGKALRPLNAGKGLIPILIALQ